MREYDRSTDDDGLPFRGLVETTCKAYQHALGETEVFWPPEDDLLSAWTETIESLMAQLEQGVSDMPWRELAKHGYTGFAARMRVETEWEQAPAKMQKAWEATVRHLVNALDFESDDDLASHEARWRDWTQQKLQTV